MRSHHLVTFSFFFFFNMGFGDQIQVISLIHQAFLPSESSPWLLKLYRMDFFMVFYIVVPFSYMPSTFLLPIFLFPILLSFHTYTQLNLDFPCGTNYFLFFLLPSPPSAPFLRPLPSLGMVGYTVRALGRQKRVSILV